jgi:acyl-CoA thioester hydrolase
MPQGVGHLEDTAMATKVSPRRADYAWFRPVTARWMDNDVYGHVNNAHYYSYFDTVINQYLIERGGLDIHSSPVVGFVVSSSCDFFRPVAYPERLEVGLRVDRTGKSSVHYGVAVFAAEDDAARAAGKVVHVFVDRRTSTSVPIPEPIRQALGAVAGASTRDEGE